MTAPLSGSSAPPTQPPPEPTPVQELSGPKLAGQNEVRMAEIAGELRSKPGTWTILGIILTAVAIPTGILGTWFVREVDYLKSEFAKVLTATEISVSASAASAKNSSDVLTTIDSLVTAIARDRSFAVTEAELLTAMKDMLPSDAVSLLVSTQNLKYFRYSNFNDNKWVFVKAKDYNLLASDIQETIKSSFEYLGVKFIVERN